MRDLVVLVAAAAAVVAVGVYLNRRQGADSPNASLNVKASGSPDRVIGGAKLIEEWQHWSYYTDGTVVSPDGTYYKNGARIWSPAEN